MTRPFGPVPDTVPPAVMLSVAVPLGFPLEAATFSTPLSPPNTSDAPVVTVMVLVAPGEADMFRKGKELSVAGFERAPVMLRLPPLLRVRLATLFADLPRNSPAWEPPPARSRVIVHVDPAPSIVTLPVTSPVWPLLRPT